MSKSVQIEVQKQAGKLTVYTVGIRESGKHGVACKQEFYGVKSKARVEDYAAWLRRLLELEAAASARLG